MLPFNGIFYPFNVTEIKIISVLPKILTSIFRIQNSKCILSVNGPGA